MRLEPRVLFKNRLRKNRMITKGISRFTRILNGGRYKKISNKLESKKQQSIFRKVWNEQKRFQEEISLGQLLGYCQDPLPYRNLISR